MADLRRTDSILVTSPLFSLAAGVLILLGVTQTAHAHISVDDGGTHKSRYSDAGLKGAPCGMAGGARGTNVYKYKPGATINVSIVETISHPGYFRIAFDSDGDDGFVTPSGTSGEMGSCSGDAKCGAGKEDYCNNETVLLDNLDAHAGAFGSQKTYTWSVKLPDIECANCTLQIIQVMNDLNIHTSPYPADDIYYQCIDIELSKSAPDVTDTPVTNKGMVCTKPAGTAGTGGSGGTAGASGAAAAAGASGAPVAGTAPSGMQAGAGGAAAGSMAIRPPASAGSAAPVSAGSRAMASGGTGASAAGMPAPVSTGGSGTTMSPATAAGAPAAAPAADSGGGCSTAASQRSASDAAALLFAVGMMALAGVRGRRRRMLRRRA